jgi:hypothetical protein
MTRPAARFLSLILATMLAASAALSQDTPPPYPPPQPAFTQAELDQMLAPIALYPDQLLSQILMAATYPLEVVEAARWSKANPGLRGDDAVTAFASQPWDPSVKSLLAFPQILAMMDEHLTWTRRLGDAFLAQEQQVMDTVQALRAKAYQAGNLRSGDEMQVLDDGGAIVLQPVHPQVVYVPYYDPLIVYGTWWWPAYPPVFWPRWPGYYVRPGFAPGFAWGLGVGISVGFFFGAFDWHHHHVNVVNVHGYYYRGSGVNTAPGPWRHDVAHRGPVPYRSAAVQRQFGRPGGVPGADARREFRGREAPQAGSRAAPPPRPQAGPPPIGSRGPAGSPPPPRPQAGPPPSGSRSPAGSAAPPAGLRESPPGAFEGIRRGGAQTRQFSERGQSSMHQRAAPPTGGAPGRAAPPGGGAPGRGQTGPQGGGAPAGGRGAPGGRR